MLYSQHKIELGIDGVMHEITINQLSANDKKRLKDFRNLGETKFTEFDNLNNKRFALQSDFSLNEQILKEGSFTDKIKLLFEQKSISKEIRELDKKIKDTHKSTEDLSIELEAYYKEMFNLSVSGPGLLALEKDIEEKGFTYKQVFETMTVLVAKAMEKK